uniref:DNTTIP1_dimer domain-containing protein n=1 Tax=Parastrongyloides trichosuri TaxID=131310 RepID=A0A0N4ZFC6_PARTI
MYSQYSYSNNNNNSIHENKLNRRIEFIKTLIASNEETKSARINSLKHSLELNNAYGPQGVDQCLHLLRMVFQLEINEEIKQILDRHLRTTFHQAIENLKKAGEHVNQNHINKLYYDILDNARQSYHKTYINQRTTYQRATCKSVSNSDVLSREYQYITSSYILNNHFLRRSENNCNNNTPTPPNKSLGVKRPHDSDDEFSEESDDGEESRIEPIVVFNGVPPKKRGRPRKIDVDSGRCGTPIFSGIDPVSIIEAEKYNPKRFKIDSKFILYSKVRKIIGKGQRGYVFLKKPRIFRYVADEYDKRWLFNHSYSTRMNGKVFILSMDDIIEFAQEENLNDVAKNDLVRHAIHLPEEMLRKVQASMIEPYKTLQSRIKIEPLTNPYYISS